MRFLMHLLFSLCVVSVVHAAKKESPTWEVLQGCSLVDAPINDGDSFLIHHQGESFIFRLYYVDAPETYSSYPERLADQARYFAIPEAQVIEAGRQASAFSQKFLKGHFTVITQWVDARGGSTARYFAFLIKDERDLASELVRNGLARIYGMPASQRWPGGGMDPQHYLKQLKSSERGAQQSSAGIWGTARHSDQIPGLQPLEPGASGARLSALNQDAYSPSRQPKPIHLNTAPAAELETLPGIGPVLAAAIIAARPIETIDSLTDISGISSNKLAALRQQITLKDLPLSPDTIDFYRADLASYLNQEVQVTIATLSTRTTASPKGFRAVQLDTGSNGESGGQIISFIPEEFYEAFVQHYSQPGQQFRGTLHQHEEQLVLVYRRN
ncbi:MAG: endonuclease YncB(thermonuclease family) [Lentimonas sp.]|jgi:endonuclease YncB( thermonuclease family)